jgi:two-component system, LytTR family, response regulator
VSVTRFEAWGDYATPHAGQARHVLHLSLNELDERLDSACFARVHQTHIVTLAQMTAFRRQGRNRLVAELKAGTIGR